MKTIARIKTLSAVIACCVALGLGAGILGVSLAPDARATPALASADPRIGDYQSAQHELEEHLELRLKLHLARMSRNLK